MEQDHSVQTLSREPDLFSFNWGHGLIVRSNSHAKFMLHCQQYFADAVRLAVLIVCTLLSREVELTMPDNRGA